MAIVAVFLALALGQAPPDVEAWLRAARDIPPAPDAAQERATLERIAKGFQMRDVHIRAAPAHAGGLHETQHAWAAHDVLDHLQIARFEDVERQRGSRQQDGPAEWEQRKTGGEIGRAPVLVGKGHERLLVYKRDC